MQQSQFARSNTEDEDEDEDDVTLVMRPGQQSPVRQAGPDDDERYCLIRHPALHTAGRTLFMPLRSEHTNAHVDTHKHS